MREDLKRKYTSWTVSVALHAIVLVVIASTGVFNMALPPEKRVLTEIEVYQMASLQGGIEGSASQASAVDSPIPDTNDVVLPDEQVKELLPEKSEEERKHIQSNYPNPVSAINGNVDFNGAGNNSNNVSPPGLPGTGNNPNGRPDGNPDAPSGPDPNSPIATVNPSMISPVAPADPTSIPSLKKGDSGRAVITGIVGPDGTVSGAYVSESSGYSAWDSEALSAFSASGFSPGMNEAGVAVATEVSRAYRFTVN